jgi:peroxiredoxin Q/BCP
MIAEPQVKIGEHIPDFTLLSSKDQAISLSDYKGKNVVIYFYPKDMTPGCTQESCDFRDYNGQFADLNTAVIGISADDVKSHEKFIEKYELPFPLLADTENKISEFFGVWKLKSMYGKEYMGIERSTFVVNANGELAAEWRKVKVEGPVTEVLEYIQNNL